MLDIRLFGGLQIKRDGVPAVGFDSVKTRALLVYLVLEADQLHGRDQLAALLWGERPTAIARASLRQALNNLQRTLGNKGAQPPFIEITRQTVQFNRAADVSVDVWEFEAALRNDERGAKNSALPSVGAPETLALYRGDLLPEMFVDDSPAFEEWLLLTREKYHHAVVEALTRLLQYHQTRGEAGHAGTMQTAQRLLELEGWYEPAHRALMEEYVRAGNRNAALAQYESLRRILGEGLGVEPSAETTALYKYLKRGDLPSRAEPPPARLLNLPPGLTPFIGRATELESITRLFEKGDCRWVTLLGPGGMGKTRLAARFAADYAPRAEWSVCYVACETLARAEELHAALANALQLQERGEGSVALEFLREQPTPWLVVLDNLEQVAGANEYIVALLRAVPRVRVLATSRERLLGAGEWVLDVQGLGLPRDETHLTESDAAELLLRSAQRVGTPEIAALDTRERRGVIEICELVDGMPLALELAGANARAFTYEQVAREIAGDIDFLEGAVPYVQPRHASVRVVIEQSWRRLDEQARAVMARLQIFRGGFTREAAIRVVPTDGRTLVQLVDRSLLRRASNGRFTMHPLIAQFSAAQAVERRDELAAHHARYFLEWVATRGQTLDGEQARRALQEFRFDLQNIRAAWNYAIASEMCGADKLVVTALAAFHDHTGLHQQGIELLRTALEHLQDAGWRAEVYASLTDLHVRIGEFDRALEAAEQTRALGAALNDVVVQARAELGFGKALARQGQLGLAQEDLERGRALAQRAGRLDLMAHCALWIGLVAGEQGSTSAGLEAVQDALDLSRQISNRRLEGQALKDLGVRLTETRAWERARVCLEQAVEIQRLLGDPWGEIRTSMTLGMLERRQGYFQTCIKIYEGAAELAQEIGDRGGYCIVMVNLCEALIDLGALARVLELARQMFALATELHLRWAELTALVDQGVVLFRLGDFAASERIAREAAVLAEQSHSLQDQINATLLLIQSLAARGKLTEAQALCEQAAVYAQEFHDDTSILLVAAETAHVALQRGDLDAARRQVDQVLARLDHTEHLLWYDWMRMLWLSRQVLLGLADERAGAIVKRAQAIVEYNAAQITDDSLREFYLNTPLHCAILNAE